MKFFLLVWGCAWVASVEARHYLHPSPIVEIKKEAPLFLKPSASSTAIADVPEGTQALARQLSPNRTWVLLEDSDGIQGWFPTNRSNLSMVAPQYVGAKQNAAATKAISEMPTALSTQTGVDRLKESDAMASAEKLEEREEVEAAPQTARSLRREFALATQWPNFPSSSVLYGAHLAYVERQMPMSLGMRVNFMLSPQDNYLTWGLGFLARWPWGKSFYREMEVGFQQLRLEEESQNSVQLSYAAGMVLANRWLADIRGGLRGFSDSQWFLGCRVTFLF